MARVFHLFRLFVLALVAALSFQASAALTFQETAQTVNLSVGFNLLGNSSSEPLDVTTAFGDPAQVVTVWKWVASTSKWAFYSPSLSAVDLQAFAATRGYDVLTSVNGGEGFWVNAKIAFSAQLPAGAAVTAASLQSSLVTPGFNLISIGDNLTPEQVGQALGAAPITLWAWNADLSNWYFYAASLAAQSATALSDFITSKGYLDFGANPLSPGTGFWVNMPAIAAPLPAEIWYFPDGAALSAGQIAGFDGQGLYFNVHSTANPVGEIRSQIVPSSAFVTDAGAANDNFSALLSGDQEVPANSSKASGYATFVLDRVAKAISGVLVTNGIVGTAAHIHSGLSGANGSVIFPLAGGPTVWTLAATSISDAQIADLSAGGYYVNAHTDAAPGGEIRGQLNQQLRFAALSGADEVPAVSTAAFATGVLALNPTTNQISGFLKTTGITGIAAHIHEAAAGANGGVIVGLTETPAGSGLWVVPAGQSLAAAQVDSFNAGNLYFNVHSAANPGGEIRGQIVAATIKVGTAALDGAKEVPAVNTAASGTGIMALNSVTRQVNGNVNTTGIDGTAGHVHAGAAGVAGPVIVQLTQTAPVSGF